MRLTIQKENSSWRQKYIVDSIRIKTVPRQGDFVTLKGSCYEVLKITIDYDNNEWVHAVVKEV